MFVRLVRDLLVRDYDFLINYVEDMYNFMDGFTKICTALGLITVYLCIRRNIFLDVQSKN